MATHKGSEGQVKIGANAISEVRSFELSESMAPITSTVMGDTAETFESGLTTWGGSVDVFWDETDTNGQVAMTVGASVTLNVYPEGSTSGDTYKTGTALVTEVSISSSHDGMVEASITVQGTGALTTATV